MEGQQADARKECIRKVALPHVIGCKNAVQARDMLPVALDVRSEPVDIAASPAIVMVTNSPESKWQAPKSP